MKKIVVNFVLGGPASGKGSFCKTFVKRFPGSVKHISAGDCLREEIQLCGQSENIQTFGSDRIERAHEIQKMIDSVQIVPAQITVDLLWEKIRQNRRFLYLIDGFPRNKQNLECWNQSMTNNCEVGYAFCLECSEETMLNRMKERMGVENRSDDRVEIFSKRIEHYKTVQKFIRDYFQSEGKYIGLDSEQSLEGIVEQAVGASGKDWEMRNLG
jgi:UMP-CMP kinase